MMVAILKKANILVFIFLFCLFVGKAEGQDFIGTSFPKVESIVLKDGEKKSKFISFDSSQLYVFIFLSPECPLCKNYSLVLNQLKEKFNTSVKFYGIIPGRTYTEEEVHRYIADYKIHFPVWFDLQKELTLYLKATVTPEVVLLDKSGSLVYRGAIDDWIKSLGQKKVRPQQHYLEEAINRYLQSKAVLINQTSPIGCLINEF